MDLRAYYQKIRQIEAEIREESVVITSLETPDGGRGGVSTEAPRAVAARLIAEQRAELASEEAAARFRAQAEAKWKAAQGTGWTKGR